MKLAASHLTRERETGQAYKRVLTFSDPAEAFTQMPVDGVTAILCDYDMPDGTGVDWLPDLIKQDVGPVMLLTATGSEQVAADAFRCGVSNYLLKHDMMANPARLHRAIFDAVRRYKLARQNRLAARELKLANLNLKDRNARLREMTETAHRFVDNVAHEFRTPLTVIQEFASIMRDGIGGEVTEEQQQFLTYIETGVRDLSGLVDDFLDTSKLKACVLRVDRQRTSIADLFEHVRPMAEARAMPKSITVSFEPPAQIPDVFIDSEKAGRVILNLIVNAIKFSSENSEVQVSAEDIGNGDVQINIRDHGIGIPEEELPKLCERFRQAGDTYRDCGKGFGLGLSIARNLAWLNLGQMSITSEVGRGSCFSFTVPIDDPDCVLSRYVRALGDAEQLSPIAVLKLHCIHPQVTAQQLRKAVSGFCHSMDLLLCSADGRTVMMLGPSEEPDRWVTRLTEAWSRNAPDQFANAQLEIEWLGSWPVKKLADQALPTVVRNLVQEKRCA